MTGQLLLKQQQYEAAKLKMEQLSRQAEFQFWSFPQHSRAVATGRVILTSC